MNIKTLIEKATAISTAVSDAVYSSLAWSGASRVINAIINGQDYTTEGKMARLACKVANERIRPTTDEVLDLLRTEPEKQELSEAHMEILVAAGEKKEALLATVESDYQASLARHQMQLANIERNEDAIREALDKLFSAKTATLPNLDNMDLEQRIISKVAKRKSNIVRDLSYDRISGEQAKVELTRINAFIAEHSLQQAV